jgi:hypothetical protein
MKKSDGVKPKPWWTSKEFSGFMSFFASGVFHEMMIMSICRRITLENLAFFILHGVVVMAEVKFRKVKGWKQDPKGLYKACAIAFNIFFFAFTGRLFVAPYLRYSSVYVN